MRNVGCIGKRKFVPDMSLVKQIDYSINQLNNICMLYPEARYSLIGTPAILPDSLGKMIKKYRFPVATLIAHGHHLHQPVWNLRKHRVKIKAEMTYLFSPDEIDTYSVEEINERIRLAFQYNDYQYQVDQAIKMKDKNRAQNLHKVLYKCPHCLDEHHMTTRARDIFCGKCGNTYHLDVYNQLHHTDDRGIFTMIPEWFEWQRKMVKEEVENQRYEITTDVYIDALPNSSGFYRLGVGKLTHNQKGFVLHADLGKDTLHLEKPVLSQYGVHVEYDYFGKGDCVSISTNNDTYYLFPVNQDVPITKYHFATEELYIFEEKIKHGK